MARTLRIGAGGNVKSDTAGILAPPPSAGRRSAEAVAPPQLPSVVVRGANFGKAVVRWARGGWATRSADEVNALLKVCHACPSGLYNASRESCAACGCPVRAAGNWRNKLALRTESCPRGHW